MLVRRLARPMLASVFVTGGLDTLRAPGGKVDAAEPVVDRIVDVTQPVAQKVAAAGADLVDTAADAAPQGGGGVATKVADAAVATRDTVQDVAAGKPLPFETETYVKVNAAVQVGAGVLLAIGKLPRLSSVALAATIVPTTLAAHRFWELEGAERDAQQIHFMKNVGLLGGLILAAVDTEGRPGLAYRAQHARQESAVAATAARANAALTSKAVRANAKAAGRLAAANATDAGEVSRRRARAVGRAARKEAAVLGALALAQAKVAQKAAVKHGHTVAEVAQTRGAELAEVASARGQELSKVAQAKGHDLAEAARASDLPDVAAAKLGDLSTKAQDLTTKAQQLAHR